MKKGLLPLFLLFFIVTYASAQTIQLRPLTKDPQRALLNRGQVLRISATDTIQIPFFDDFAGYTGKPDPSKWIQGGGVFINNTFALNPPSYNTATFDGMNEDGEPYVRNASSTNGTTDILTSLPINLSAFAPSDSIYLSFFWQAASIGELPDPINSDRLVLQFKDNAGIWREMWYKEADSSKFHQVLIPVNEQHFLYKGFQFRFLSIGSQIGIYDIWNLDYIYLNANRNSADTNYMDVAIVSGPGSILKNYTAMPYWHFNQNWQNEVKPQLNISVYNHSNATNPQILNNPIQSFNKLIDGYTGEIIDSFEIQAVINKKSFASPSWTLDYSKIAALNRPVKVISSLLPSASDSVLFSKNNHFRDSTDLNSYYAYDDGVPEAILISNDNTAAIINKFTPVMPDYVIGVAVKFVPFDQDATDIKLNIGIWSSVTPYSNQETILAIKEVRLVYPDLISGNGESGFTPYFFDEPVYVSGDFYVGYEPKTILNVAAGIDLNHDNSSKIFYRLNGIWIPYADTQYPGTLMVRPIFGNEAHPTLGYSGKQITVFNCELYPNPSTGILTSSEAIRRVTIYDISGSVIDHMNTGSTNNLNLSHLLPGTYLLKLENEKGNSVVKRVVIVR